MFNGKYKDSQVGMERSQTTSNSNLRPRQETRVPQNTLFEFFLVFSNWPPRPDEASKAKDWHNQEKRIWNTNLTERS